MKKILTIFLLLAAVVKGDTLYWQVSENATVDGGSIYQFVNSYGTYDWVSEYDGNTYSSYNVAARVKVTGGNLSQPEYLNIYVGGGEFEDGSTGLDLSPDTGGYWGLGVPSPIQSSVAEYGYGSEMFREYTFMVELGEITWDDVADTIEWTTIAQSDEFAGAMLEQYIHERFDLNPPNLATWSPLAYHTTPEPSSGILFLIGLSFLLLKRPKPFT